MAAVEVAVSQCVLDFNLYPRHNLDEGHVSTLMESLRAGAEFPPIILERSTFRIVDGAHRREATQRLFGDDAPIKAELRDYPDEAAIFQESMLYNGRHGRRLSTYDRVRCVLLARDLGISDDLTAKSLAITREKLDQLVLTRTAIAADETVVPLKLTSKALAGRSITAPQIVGNKAAGGMPISYYAAQIRNALESGLVDSSNLELAERLTALRDAIDLWLTDAEALAAKIRSGRA